MINKIILSSKTPFSNMFTADQIFGQIVWAISDIFGKNEADTLITEYQSNPPFLVSSLLIDGYLPKPFYLDANNDTSTEVGLNNKKCHYLTYSDFKYFQDTGTDFSSKKLSLEAENIIVATHEIHNTVDRNSFTTLENGLFNTRYLLSNANLSFYINFINENWKEKVYEALRYIAVIGLGGDKNIGHGQFDIKTEELSETEKSIFSYKKSNVYVSLSESSGKDLEPLYYQIDVYAGIKGRIENDGSYRKHPHVRYLTGSVFLDGIGELIKDDNASYFYGLSFPIYLNKKIEGDKCGTQK